MAEISVRRITVRNLRKNLIKKDREISSEKFPKHDISQNQQTAPPPTLPCSRNTKSEN